ncbi:hypothetical protein EVAR_56566_1 [Eumeta japonica]|uniref:Uncharacterized protein n=1 Tax=Eumeta variegata TaxID=151549 RepID=A0A4C1YXV3_EUMVA|nr:hypothetical protein EVAR_56566_1 [Eumeta japonica]
MRMERSICTLRYRTLVCHSTSYPQSLSFSGVVRCWPVSRAAVFVTWRNAICLVILVIGRGPSGACPQPGRHGGIMIGMHCHLLTARARRPLPNPVVGLRELGCHRCTLHMDTETDSCLGALRPEWVVDPRSRPRLQRRSCDLPGTTLLSVRVQAGFACSLAICTAARSATLG